MQESIYLPPMLVQPLLENAHKFGIFSRSETNMILMTVNVEKGDLIFKIEDFGQGIKDDAENNPSGNRNRPNALRIIKERLALSKTPNSRNGTLILLNKKDMDETKQGTLAIIKIPINIQHETNN
jgi:LytS/YehU family sensor histidine kinase